MKIASAFHVDLTMMKNFEDPEIIEAYKQMCKCPAKNQIQLSSGETLTINTYKMYLETWHNPVTKERARYLKCDFIDSVAKMDYYYRKFPGKIPAGFVIQVQMAEKILYGCSVKSHLDKWDRKKGLKVAYTELMRSFDTLDLSLTKDERRKIAEIVGLCN
jgi:hypothetical protein